jgi:hypothetical protein
MGEIDHIAQIEDKRKPERHQNIEGADDKSVCDVKEKQLRHGSPS